MRLLFSLFAFLPIIAVSLAFVDLISPELFPRHILSKIEGVQGNVVLPAKDGPPQCNWGTFQLCFASFIRDAGLSAYNTMNATYLAMAVNQFLAAGAQNGPSGAANNLFQLCRAQQKFFGTCLGPNQADQCVSAIEFIRQGNTSNDGFGYQMLFTRLNFECGIAFTSFIPHAMEVAQTPTTQATALGTCLDTFIGSLSNLTVSEFCGPMELYTECVGKIYTRAAQGSIDFGWSVCEAARLGNIITLPMCTDSKWACKLANLI